ncbi:hypothetical protein RJ640_002805 [Escallonia rubra]|uniref:Retrotransposon Copia-like N-terminal domain-containing protein n=1 Tax=Escallonia rubra TaxID=112253 RepID=A0AA88U8B1_9ASTE|nr:hypothetical protein RJ640_002805 [Escallonia rubra]
MIAPPLLPSAKSQSNDSRFSVDHCDSPYTALVSTKLTNDNYILWCRAMMMALGAKNKLGIVDGTISEPLADDDSFPAWNQDNRLVLSWLINSIHKDLVPTITLEKYDVALWNNLHDRFYSSIGDHIFHLHCTVATHQQGKDSIRSARPLCLLHDIREEEKDERNEKHLAFLGVIEMVDTKRRMRGLSGEEEPSLSRTYGAIYT